jgi:hypothetical protein
MPLTLLDFYLNVFQGLSIATDMVPVECTRGDRLYTVTIL